MKTRTRIDSAGRLVIPQELRNRFGMTSGSDVEMVAMPDGIFLGPVRLERKVVRRGRITAIDAGAGAAPAEVFGTAAMRSEQLGKKAGISE